MLAIDFPFLPPPPSPPSPHPTTARHTLASVKRRYCCSRTVLDASRHGVFVLVTPRDATGMKADALPHPHQYHHQQHPDHLPTVPMPTHSQPSSGGQRVVYLSPSCPIEERTSPRSGQRQQTASIIDQSPKHRWSRSLSWRGRAKRCQSLGRDGSDTSAPPPSLPKNGFQKTWSWIKNIRPPSFSKNRSNLQCEETTQKAEGDHQASSVKHRYKGDKDFDDSKRYVREGGGGLPSSVSHDNLSGTTHDRQFYPLGVASKYRHSVIGHVGEDKNGEESYPKDYFKLHYPRIITSEPREDPHHLGSGPASSQERHTQEDGVRSRGSMSWQSSSSGVQHRHSVIADAGYVQDYVQEFPHHQQFHQRPHPHPGTHVYSEGLSLDQTSHGFSREQRTFSLSAQGIDNPGFSESMDNSNNAGPSDTSDGASHRNAASSLGSTVTRILRARLFGRAKSSISLHLEKASEPSAAQKKKLTQSHDPLPVVVHPRPSSSVSALSALNLGTDYNISAVKLRPKKGQGGDSKHVYVVNKDTKPSRPRSCATLPRDAKLGKSPLLPVMMHYYTRLLITGVELFSSLWDPDVERRKEEIGKIGNSVTLG
ncbi:hypothetical protein ACOMHN_048435 [Nucella lapillus]